MKTIRVLITILLQEDEDIAKARDRVTIAAIQGGGK